LRIDVRRDKSRDCLALVTPARLKAILPADLCGLISPGVRKRDEDKPLRQAVPRMRFVQG
jgi:hypothetical protein